MPRPPGFERSAVLDTATGLFWRQGYGATTVADLVAETGLRPGSLYAAFGSKKRLFIEVLDRYHDAFMVQVDHCISEAPSPVAAIRRLLEKTAADTAGDAERRGCLAVNAMLEMAALDDDISNTLRRQNDRLKKRLAHVLTRAVEKGELQPEVNADSLALFLLNNLWGMRVMCKSAPPLESLNTVVDRVMAALETRESLTDSG